MNEGWVFPSLRETTVIEKDIALFEFPQNTLLFVLFDRVSDFSCGDFKLFSVMAIMTTTIGEIRE
jgi:hypothetical protein